MRNLISITLLAFLMLGFVSCKENENAKLVKVEADGETEAVASTGDAADDPAIWYNFSDPASSVIFGSDKQKGIIAYNLDGEILSFTGAGRINNIDVRYGFDLGNRKIDLLGGSNRSDNSIVIYEILPDSGKLRPLLSKPVISGVDEVYGFALYHRLNPDTVFTDTIINSEKLKNVLLTNNYYAFVNSKKGEIEQWEILPDNDSTIKLNKVREIKLKSQLEGMVADDELGYLYVGEENKGIWKFFADPYINNDRKLIADTTESYLVPDIEGLTMYYAKDKSGYLLASVQGINQFAVFERLGTNKYVGNFAIIDGLIDGAEETDGIDVLNLALGSKYPDGIFVVQDGYNFKNSDSATQNFKMVSWGNIAKSFNPELMVDNSYGGDE